MTSQNKMIILILYNLHIIIDLIKIKKKYNNFKDKFSQKKISSMYISNQNQTKQYSKSSQMKKPNANIYYDIKNVKLFKNIKIKICFKVLESTINTK